MEVEGAIAVMMSRLKALSLRRSGIVADVIFFYWIYPGFAFLDTFGIRPSSGAICFSFCSELLQQILDGVFGDQFVFFMFRREPTERETEKPLRGFGDGQNKYKRAAHKQENHILTNNSKIM